MHRMVHVVAAFLGAIWCPEYFYECSVDEEMAGIRRVPKLKRMSQQRASVCGEPLHDKRIVI